MHHSSRFDLEPFLTRLAARSPLTVHERQAVLNLPGQSVQVRSNSDFVRVDERVDHVSLVVAGVVGRFGQDRDGRRQITMMHIAGDMADLHSVVLPLASTALRALSTATILRVPHAAIRAAAMRFPALAEAFWRDCSVDAAILAQWVVNVGRRDARQRVSHLLCEMSVRTVGARAGANEVVFQLPVSQAQLADATGLTAVHVNRTLQSLRADGLIHSPARMVVRVPDWNALAAAGDFDPGYLSADPRVERTQARNSTTAERNSAGRRSRKKNV